MKKMGAGTPYDKVVLSVLKKVGADDSAMQPYLTITLLNAFIENSSVSMGANGAPQETVIIGYAKVEFQYKSQNEDGSLSEDPTWRYDSTTGKNYG
jgi:type VI protein secretion system component Hcp